MSRRRYISTDISIDHQLNKASDFAAFFYTWMIPHVADDCRIAAKCAEQLRLLVMPGRNHSVEEVEAAVDELKVLGVIGQDDDGTFFVPSESFYKYQTYVIPARRRETPQNSAKQRETPKLAAIHRVSPQNTASVNLNLSLNLKEDPAGPAEAAGTCEKKKLESEAGNGQLRAANAPPGVVEPSRTASIRAPADTSSEIPEELVKLAVKLGGTSRNRQYKLCQWVISMVRTLGHEPPERVHAVTLASLRALEKHLASGDEIDSLWAYLTAIFNSERTKYIQGQENTAHKNGPIPAAVSAIMKGIGTA